MIGQEIGFWEDVPGLVWELEKLRQEDWTFTRRYGEYLPEHRRDTLGQKLFDIFPPGHPICKHILEGIKSKQYFTFIEGSSVGKIFHTRCKPILDQQGEVFRLIGVTIDITESIAPGIASLEGEKPAIQEINAAIYEIAQETILQPDLYDRLFMVYQPIINFQHKPNENNWITGVEALVRLRIEDRIIPPNYFLPLIESKGLSVGVSCKVIQTTIQEIGPIAYQYPNFFLSINITADDLMHPEVLELLQDSIEKKLLPEGRLHLEIIETPNRKDIHENPEALNILYQLRDLNIKITVDDFGKQSSNFDRLSLLAPNDVLKIDKSFIPLEIYDQKSAISTAMIWVAKAFNLKVVAEGIESLDQANFMKMIGCDYGQGYYFYRPMEIAKLCETLNL